MALLKPDGCRIEVQRDDGLSIYIPPLTFSQYGHGLVFGICFTSVPALIVGMVCYQAITHLNSTSQVDWESGLWKMILIGGILFVFVLAGLSVISMKLAEATQRSTISLQDGLLTVSKKHFIRGRDETWPVDTIHSLKVVSAKDPNDSSRFHLELRLQTQGEFRLLAENRSRDELEWLADLLRRNLPGALGLEAAKQSENQGQNPNETIQTRSDHFLPGETSNLEQDIEGAVVCSRCDSVYRIGDHRINCQNCGAPLVLKEEEGVGKRRRYVGSFAKLESLIDWSHTPQGEDKLWFAAGGTSMREQVAGGIQCGWCDELYETRPDSPNCARCGGALPLPPSSEFGPPPPDTPRPLPRGFKYRLYWNANRIGFFSLLIIAGSLAMFWLHWPTALVLLGLGLAVGRVAFVRRFRRHRALRNGRTVPGRIETVHCAKSHQKLKLYRVYYRFDLENRPVRGVKWTYSPTICNHFVGQPVWVVYVQRDPRCNDLWPPFN